MLASGNTTRGNQANTQVMVPEGCQIMQISVVLWRPPAWLIVSQNRSGSCSEYCRKKGGHTAVETVPPDGGGGEVEPEADGELGLGGVREAEGPAAGPLMPVALVGAMPAFRARAQPRHCSRYRS